MPAGRPTDYGPHILEKVERYFEDYEPWYENPVEKQDKHGNVTISMERIPNPPPSVLDLTRQLKISRSAFYRWMDDYPKLKDMVKRRIEQLYPEVLQENAMLGRYQHSFAIFAAKNRMGWTDKQEQTHGFSEDMRDFFSQYKTKTRERDIA